MVPSWFLKKKGSYKSVWMKNIFLANNINDQGTKVKLLFKKIFLNDIKKIIFEN